MPSNRTGHFTCTCKWVGEAGVLSEDGTLCRSLQFLRGSARMCGQHATSAIQDWEEGWSRDRSSTERKKCSTPQLTRGLTGSLLLRDCTGRKDSSLLFASSASLALSYTV